MKVFKSTRSGFLEDQDLQKLTDKQGNLIFCYKCKGSALSGGPIARCDYCTLSWHLDCLNPPLPTVKTVGTKWKCPNHADHSFNKNRRPKNAIIVDTNLRRGYRNDGNIDILDSSDEEQLENHTRSLPFRPHSKNLDVSTTKSENIKKPIAESATSQSVKLDFTQSVRQNNEDSTASNIQTMLALDEVALKPASIREGVRNLCYLKAAGTLDEHAAKCRTNVELLLVGAQSLEAPLKPKLSDTKAVNRLDPSEPLPAPDGLSSKENGSSDANTHSLSSHSRRKESLLRKASPGVGDISSNTRSRNSSPFDGQGIDEIHPDEHPHLLAIKRLIEMKGKDTFMEFLLPKEVEK